jgi:hypothetical protein
VDFDSVTDGKFAGTGFKLLGFDFRYVLHIKHYVLLK